VAHVVPIFFVNKEKKIEFQGSSIYCHMGPIKFLLTAHHVLQELFDQKLRPLILTDDDLLNDIPCTQFTFSKDSSLDIAICVLDSPLKMYAPYNLEGASNFQQSDDFQAILLGFLGKGVKVREGLIKAKYEGYQTQNASISEYTRLGVDPEKFCICEFKKEKVFREKLRSETFPNPNGMSGGPIFQFPNSNAKNIRLVGMMLRWDTEREKAVIGVRIEEIRKMFSVTRIV